MYISVEMKQKTTMMALALMMVASLMFTSMGAYASGNVYTVKNMKTEPVRASLQTAKAAKHGYQKVQQVRNPLQNRILFSPELEEELDPKQLEAVDLPSIIEAYNLEKPVYEQEGECIWILIAHGYAYDSSISTDAVSRVYRTGMRITAKPVWASPWGLFFKVTMGKVGFNGTRDEVTGFGLAKNGKFYMTMDGEDISLEAMGKIYPRPPVTSARRPVRFHRIAMKGRMNVEGDDYVFKMRGWAFRRCIVSLADTE